MITAFEEHYPEAGIATFLLDVHRNIPTLQPRPKEEVSGNTNNAWRVSRMIKRSELGGFLQFLIDACAEIERQNFTGGIAYLGTCMEALFMQVAITLSGKPSIENAGLKNIVIDHLAPLLGLVVDLKDGGDPVGDWFIGGYALRNHVVHEAHRPNFYETLGALHDSMNAIEEIRSAIATRYPHSPLLDPLQTACDYFANSYPAWFPPSS